MKCILWCEGRIFIKKYIITLYSKKVTNAITAPDNDFFYELRYFFANIKKPTAYKSMKIRGITKKCLINSLMQNKQAESLLSFLLEHFQLVGHSGQMNFYAIPFIYTTFWKIHIGVYMFLNCIFIILEKFHPFSNDSNLNID